MNPMNPTNPTNPMNPTNPTNPTNPMNPIDSTNSSFSSQTVTQATTLIIGTLLSRVLGFAQMEELGRLNKIGEIYENDHSCWRLRNTSI